MTTTPRTAGRALSARALALASLASISSTVAACGDDGDALADGALQVTIFGGAALEDRIQANDVADGWTIDVSRFLVAVSQVSVGREGAAAALVADETRVFDLTKPSNGLGHLVVVGDVAGGTYDALAFTIGPAESGALAGNATQADVAAMVAGGLTLLVEGTATKGGEAIDFAWTFTGETRFEPCEIAARVDGGTASVQIAVHGERLFADALEEGTADLRFQAIADADSDDDDAVTLDELGAAPLGTDYDVGGRVAIDDLRAFIEAQARGLAGVDAGDCTTVE
ncbi:MAG: hypothetical protein IT385_18910 [Deltaproteobacteria bacterium]|nr:hypothetical protein [Deltaproteobacteria bacterium]